MTGNERLYLEIRNFVKKDEVDNFDIDFFAKKHSYKSMFALINKYVVVKKIVNDFKDPNAKIVLAKIENKLLFNPKLLKEIKKCKTMSTHRSTDFLFKDSQYS